MCVHSSRLSSRKHQRHINGELDSWTARLALSANLKRRVPTCKPGNREDHCPIGDLRDLIDWIPLRLSRGRALRPDLDTMMATLESMW